MKKSPMVMIMIGHVDSGKSTISGQLLIQAGVINELEVQKLK
jgi:translation elongation factor EF-1alpha